MTYLFIATGKITHKDLFLETPVKLPILSVDVPLLSYFVAAPVFVIAAHFYFLIQLRGLATKFRAYDAILFGLPETELGQAERLRHRIDNSLFAQLLGGPRSAADFFLRLVAVTTVAIVPLLLLLYIQLSFLPIQSDVTNLHRMLVATDAFLIVLVCVLGAIALFGARYVREIRWRPAKWWRRAIWVSTDVWTLVSPMLLMLPVVLLAAAAVWFSVDVARRADEWWPDTEKTRALFLADADPVRQGPSFWFSNRLVLPDQNLIEGFDPDKAKVTRSLRGRHFVSAIFDRADLRQVDFTGADLSFASLQSAKLDKAQFGCATLQFGCTQLQKADLSRAEMHRALLRGANMKGALLTFAKLDGALLEGANMMGAVLDSAQLDDASMTSAQLQGASLNQADLRAADLSAAGMDGASLIGANLTATVLFYAQLQGADLTRASMFGALLDSALAQDASFENTQMQGASLQWTYFNGAKFSKTSVYGTDVSGARFKAALIEDDVSKLPKWDISHLGLYTDYSEVIFAGDPFGKESDRDNDDLGYVGTYGSVAPVKIPAAERDRLAALFPGRPPDQLQAEIKQRLARLAPGSATADWTKLADKPSSEKEYLARLGERLILIACAKEGEGHVARGLWRGGRLCPYKTEVEAVLNSGLVSGKVCADMERFKQIWNEAITGSACKPLVGGP
ncbi:MAG: pentapeptide repeat-containing protein [Beijerinckiaceae bacterium]